MLLDANSSDEVACDLASELVIVGAGTIGLYLAAALSESGQAFKIIVVESGPNVPNTARNHLTSSSIGRPHNGVHLGRAAGLGGTSSLWGGQLAEFGEADLERPDAPWPLAYDELRRLYAEVYLRLGIGTPSPTAFYRGKLGGESAEPGSIERFFTYWLDQPNFATLYKKMIQSHPSVHVVVNLTANRCEFDGPNARLLRCTSASGRNVCVRSSKFVFASGTVETNRFFLSTRRDGGVPWAANDNIGLFFQDHLGGQIAKVSILDEQRFRDYFENGWVNGIKLQPKLTLSHGLRQSMPSGVCGEFSFDSSITENLRKIKATIRGVRSGLSFSSAASRITDVLAVSRSILPIVSRYLRNRRIFAPFDRGVSFNIQAEQIPIAGSMIRLQDADRAGDGLIPVAVDWKCDGRELAAIYRLAFESNAYLRGLGIAELHIDPALEANDAAFLDTLVDTYHQCGGMRMSASPCAGVVSGECRVWGTSNVWVAGVAVLPSSSHANCTLTALAIATRLLPWLREDYRSA